MSKNSDSKDLSDLDELNELIEELTGVKKQKRNFTHVVRQDYEGNTIAVFSCEEDAEEFGEQIYPDHLGYLCWGGYLNALLIERATSVTLH